MAFLCCSWMSETRVVALISLFLTEFACFACILIYIRTSILYVFLKQGTHNSVVRRSFFSSEHHSEGGGSSWDTFCLYMFRGTQHGAVFLRFPLNTTQQMVPRGRDKNRGIKANHKANTALRPCFPACSRMITIACLSQTFTFWGNILYPPFPPEDPV